MRKKRPVHSEHESSLDKLIFSLFKWLSLFVTLLSFAILLVSVFQFVNDAARLTKPSAQDGLAMRIEAASTDLGNTASELAAIQTELEAQINFVSNLQKDASDAEAILNLSESDVMAVKSLLHSEFEESKQADFWVQVVMGFVYLVLGVIIDRLILKWPWKWVEHLKKQPTLTQ